MKLKIDKLGIETTLESFVNDWELDIDEVKKELNDGYYSDEWVSIEIGEDDCLNVDIITHSFEIIDIINNRYNNEFLFVVKDVWNGETDEGDDVEYTSFTIEGGNPDKISDITFKGGEYEEKTILTKEEYEKFIKLQDEGLINFTDLIKYQTFYFPKKKDLKENGWYKTIELFELYDWEKYPSKF